MKPMICSILVNFPLLCKSSRIQYFISLIFTSYQVICNKILIFQKTKISQFCLKFLVSLNHFRGQKNQQKNRFFVIFVILTKNPFKIIMSSMTSLKFIGKRLLNSPRGGNSPLLGINIVSTRGFYAWLNSIFNRVDPNRIKEVGPDRACAEWLIRCGASVKWVNSQKFMKDYNS